MDDGKEYTYREPTQKPIDPPYKSALALKRNQGGGTNLEDDERADVGKTKSVEECLSAMLIGANSSEEQNKDDSGIP